jgi:hypothetical protein
MEHESKNVDIKVEAKDGLAELVIRHGEARKVLEPKQFSAKTTIDGPYKYLKGIDEKSSPTRGGDIVPSEDRAIVLVDSVAGQVKLVCVPDNPLGAIITGVLQENPQLASFKVNSSKKWTGDELAAHVYANANLFNVPTKEVREFAAKFRNLKAKISKEIENVKDDAGNIVDNFVQKVSVEDLPKLPFITHVYLGGEKFEFEVEVGIEAANRGVVFYLFSAELASLLESEKEKALNVEAQKFISAGITVMEVVS